MLTILIKNILQNGTSTSYRAGCRYIYNTNILLCTAPFLINKPPFLISVVRSTCMESQHFVYFLQQYEICTYSTTANVRSLALGMSSQLHSRLVRVKPALEIIAIKPLTKLTEARSRMNELRLRQRNIVIYERYIVRYRISEYILGRIVAVWHAYK